MIEKNDSKLFAFFSDASVHLESMVQTATLRIMFRDNDENNDVRGSTMMS